VPIYYDALVAKLCVWAETREGAINRLARVLGEYAVEGVRTTIPFFRAVVQSEEFRRGEFDTGFIDRFLKGLANENLSRDEQDTALEDIAVIASVLHARARATQEQKSPSATESRWKLQGRLAQRK